MMHYEETMIMMEKFKKAKFSEEQTKVILEAVESVQKSGLENLATKQDIHNLDLKIAGLDLKIAETKSELKEEISDLKGKFSTMQWMMGFSLTMTSAIILKLFW